MKLPVLIGICILVLLLIGAGGYVLGTRNTKTITKSKIVATATPTPDITADWNTYTDPTYGFSLKYPADFRSFPPDTTYYDSSGYHVRLMSNPYVHNPNESFGDGFSIDVLPNPNTLSSIEYIKTVAFSQDLPGWNNNKQPTKTIPFPGIDATRIEVIEGGKGEFGPVAFIADGDLMIEIIGQNPSKTNAAIFNQLITTFMLSKNPNTNDHSTALFYATFIF